MKGVAMIRPMDRYLSPAILLIAMAASPVLADGTSFNFRAGGGGGGRGGNGGGGGGAAAPAPQSTQQQFFSQSASRQQQFFAQPVFPHSNFSQTNALPFSPSFVPPSVVTQTTWVSPQVNYYLPPQYYSSYQPGFYVAPTYYNNGPTIYVQSTEVYQTQQPVTTFVPAQQRMSMGMIGRW